MKKHRVSPNENEDIWYDSSQEGSSEEFDNHLVPNKRSSRQKSTGKRKGGRKDRKDNDEEEEEEGPEENHCSNRKKLVSTPSILMKYEGDPSYLHEIEVETNVFNSPPNTILPHRNSTDELSSDGDL